METINATAEPTQTKVEWVLDPSHTEIAFKVRHLMITNIKGVFNEFQASIQTTGEDFRTAEIDFWMDPSSVDTGDKSRDVHLRSKDFFDVANFNKITFKGKAVEPVDNDGSYELYGDLTIKGITKTIELDVEFGGVRKDPWGNTKAGLTINKKINRKDWDLNWNAALEAGGVLLSDSVYISCEVQLLKHI